MTTLRYFSSEMAGSPGNTSNVVGTTSAMLDACLIDGFVPQGISSMSHDGTTVTVTMTAAHGIPKSAVMTISGANEAGYNGEFVVLVVDATTLSYGLVQTALANATGALLGTIGGAGWTKPFAPTNNVHAYKTGAGSLSRFMQLSETTGLYSYACHGYEDMTDSETGSNAFAPTSRLARPSSTSSKPWHILATENFLYIVTNGHTTSVALYLFGDYNTIDAADPYATLCFGMADLANWSSFNVNSNSLQGQIARNRLGVNPATLQLMTHHTCTIKIGSGTMTYPQQNDGSFHMAGLEVFESNYLKRGTLDHIFSPLHLPTALANQTTFDGQGDYAGRRFIYLQLRSMAVVFELP
ncbi:MAG: hypothetical protein COA83_09750 [Methylophaga sp.]|nr:MAG: hypothetical protein COA83_09750 [Methylophaga sp.]